MKKTLLFFLLLLPSIFYAQISSIIHCAGDTTFDLTSRYDELTKGISPDQTITIKYYDKDTYAINDQYAIVDPKHYVFTESSIKIHVTIKTSGGSSIMNSFSLILNYPLEFAYANVTNPACGSTKLTMNARGGRIPYKFSLDGVNYQSENVFNDVAPGSYNLNIKDAYECITSSNLVVDPITPITATSVKMDNSCFGFADGRIEVTAAGGKGSYTYSKNGTDYQASNIFSNLAAGNYNITVQDAIGCKYVYTVTILSPLALLSVPIITDVSIPGGNNGEITVNTSGGTGAYSYILRNNVGAVIRPSQSSNKFTDLGAGTYNIEVRDAKSCSTINSNIIIKAPSPPLAAIASSTVINCTNPTGTITVLATGGSGSYQYSLNNDEIYRSSNVFANVAAGNYLVTVRDSNNIKTTTFITVNVAQPLLITSEIVSEISCNGAKDAVIKANVLQGQSPYFYSIDNTELQTSDTFSNLSAGIHTIRVVDQNGCNVIVSVTLFEPAIVQSTAVVNDKTITASATGGTLPYSYFLEGNNGVTVGPQSSNIFENLPPGIYSLQTRDKKGCIFLENNINVSGLPFLSATATINPVTCDNQGGMITVNATGGSGSYQYSLNNNPNYSASNVFSNLAPGVYTINVKDSQNATISIMVTIAPSALPVITISTITNNTSSNSNDGSITVSTNGGIAPYTYTLLNSNNIVIIPSQLSNTFNNLAAGTYGVTVTDAKGCSSSITLLTISAPSPLIATTTISAPNCVDPTGIITVNATGGTFPYQYSIDNGVTFTVSDTFIVTQSGNYIVVVRDAQNDTYTSVVVVKPLDPLFINATVIANASCISNGTIMATAVGGQTPYSYSINGGVFQLSDTFNNLNAGVYNIAARDNNGCIANTTLIIQDSLPLVALVTVDNQTITVNVTGGTGIYQYSLDGGSFQSSNIFTVANYGTYQIFARDLNGCIVVVSTTVNPPSPLIDGKVATTIAFKAGQTLGDLVIEGQNIKWYSSKGATTGKTSKTSEISLPLTTLLVDGVTYYASQTINGIESTERLAVTAKVNGSLSAPDFVLPNFKYYPNPVQHNLTIDNTENIDDVEIISVSGKSILSKKINNTHSEIDLSNVASGFYFLKVKAEGKFKTIKIVKK
jgi:hypothetical protein